jgi:hypothetical protein
MAHASANAKESANEGDCSKEANILAKESEVEKQVADVGHVGAIVSGLNSLNVKKLTLGKNNLQNHSSRKGLMRQRTTNAQISC